MRPTATLIFTLLALACAPALADDAAAETTSQTGPAPAAAEAPTTAKTEIAPSAEHKAENPDLIAKLADDTQPSEPLQLLNADLLGSGGLALPDAPDLVGPPAEIWTRLRAGFAMPDINDASVRKWERWYSSRPDYVARMVERSRRYLYHIASEVERRHMPMEVAILPMIESAYNPMALSRARAMGIWQFIPSTGKNYGMQQNWWFDARRDVITATQGALDYLETLHTQFGDWQLALAAYNYGENGIARAIARNQAKHKPTDYASLRMPTETRQYLPKLQAVKNIVMNPQAFGLALAEIPDAPYFKTVVTPELMDVKLAAELAEMPMEEFLSLNPAYNRPVIGGAAQHTLLLPADKADLFSAKIALAEQPLVSWQAYQLKAGERIETIAPRFGLSAAALRAANGIRGFRPLPPGVSLLVPASAETRAAGADLRNAAFVPPPTEMGTVTHRVKRGDTLASIAERYGTTVADVQRWNRSAATGLQVGQKLRIGDPEPRLYKTAKKSKHAKGKPKAPAKSKPKTVAQAKSKTAG